MHIAYAATHNQPVSKYCTYLAMLDFPHCYDFTSTGFLFYSSYPLLCFLHNRQAPQV